MPPSIEVDFLALEHFFHLTTRARMVEQKLLFLVICNMQNFWKSEQALSLVKVTESFLKFLN